ncbi:hypothetical protein MT414_13980 [Mammaliicoccus sciuri]|uniref:hypothetical protein n=1 Tax=Mammaliicoccus sciuri TaxID=1296 RepID=UPI001FB33DDD|nr:hypothetical protein [Mammaliicoccus sciuri]MCJ1763123.1 hypothetical protein [Mammaliicoccus sciuri]
MKKFKYCNDKQMDQAVNRYKNGGNNNNIYVRVFETGQLETIEVFKDDIGFAVFDSVEEMYEYFRATGKPYVKDLLEGKQMNLF